LLSLYKIRVAIIKNNYLITIKKLYIYNLYMNSIKLPFTSELRGGGKTSSFKIMTGAQLERKINRKVKTQLQSGSILNYVKKVIFPNTSLLNTNNNTNKNNTNNNNNNNTKKKHL